VVPRQTFLEKNFDEVSPSAEGGEAENPLATRYVLLLIIN
jgi:hypothetical protein